MATGLFAIRRLLLRGTRNAGSRAVLLDALIDHDPELMRKVLERADLHARQKRTATIVYLHPNFFKRHLIRFRARSKLMAGDFALWPRGRAARIGPPRRYGYVEIYRTPDYRRRES